MKEKTPIYKVTIHKSIDRYAHAYFHEYGNYQKHLKALDEYLAKAFPEAQFRAIYSKGTRGAGFDIVDLSLGEGDKIRFNRTLHLFEGKLWDTTYPEQI